MDVTFCITSVHPKVVGLAASGPVPPQFPQSNHANVFERIDDAEREDLIPSLGPSANPSLRRDPGTTAGEFLSPTFNEASYLGFHLERKFH